MSPHFSQNCSHNSSQNSVIHQIWYWIYHQIYHHIFHQICHRAFHQFLWITTFVRKFVTEIVRKFVTEYPSEPGPEIFSNINLIKFIFAFFKFVFVKVKWCTWGARVCFCWDKIESTSWDKLSLKNKKENSLSTGNCNFFERRLGQGINWG